MPRRIYMPERAVNRALLPESLISLLVAQSFVILLEYTLVESLPGRRTSRLQTARSASDLVTVTSFLFHPTKVFLLFVQIAEKSILPLRKKLRTRVQRGGISLRFAIDLQPPRSPISTYTFLICF